MGIEGWYYLHTNGDLIYKKELGGTHADIRESDFAAAMWPVDPSDREGAWDILVEGLSAGAKKDRVKNLAQKWSCDDKDAYNYAERVGINLEIDGDMFCAKTPCFENLQESCAGFGDSALEAMANLCSQLGHKPGKMWSQRFREFIKSKVNHN